MARLTPLVRLIAVLVAIDGVWSLIQGDIQWGLAYLIAGIVFFALSGGGGGE